MTPFESLVAGLAEKGLSWHGERILANSKANAPHVVNTLRAVPPDTRPCLIISAGPSLYREKILQRVHGKFKGTIVATDGAYIQCLRAGVVPDYVITLDPHPTRMVRWFGDPEIESNMNGDDYFARQDLDVAFRENQSEQNQININLVDKYRVPLIISTSSPSNVVARTLVHERYWFAPLVDDPEIEGSLTSKMVEMTRCPAMNTGGTVGSAAWVFAHSILQSTNIAAVGMDVGYYADTPLEQTQSWHMLNGDQSLYRKETGPWGEAYTDPTYYWYRSNLLELLKANDATLTNCSGAGLLYGSGVACKNLEEWLNGTT